MSKGAVELVNLSKDFAGSVAVDDISIKIEAGSYCCLLGPSGVSIMIALNSRLLFLN